MDEVSIFLSIHTLLWFTAPLPGDGETMKQFYEFASKIWVKAAVRVKEYRPLSSPPTRHADISKRPLYATCLVDACEARHSQADRVTAA